MNSSMTPDLSQLLVEKMPKSVLSTVVSGGFVTHLDLLELRGKKYNGDIELEVMQWTGI